MEHRMPNHNRDRDSRSHYPSRIWMELGLCIIRESASSSGETILLTVSQMRGFYPELDDS
jgi:hypothetical protein